jgi:tripartite-type tricarboxylate transporter receptor subunit TctC
VLDRQRRVEDAALKDPEFIKRQEALGAVVVTDNRVNPADHKKFVEAEIAKWGPAIKAAGNTPTEDGRQAAPCSRLQLSREAPPD